MSEFHTSYYKFDSPQDDNEACNDEEAYLMHVPERKKAWHHIEDLDSFFIRVYQYFQNHGFTYILSQRILEFLEFVFIVGLLTFLSSCVNYDMLFANNLPLNATGKIGIEDVVYSSGMCFSRIGRNPFLVICLIVASVVGLFRAGKIFYHYFQLKEIQKFYRFGLHIKPEELNELSWQEVQKRLMHVQKEQQMCIHKQDLTELDIYNRILRFKNYMVAMVNKGLLPPRFKVPFLGDTVFFTEGLKFNLELLLFRGPTAIFASRFHLKEEYKVKGRREELADRLSQDILRLGLFNLLLSPIIFLWQVWYTFLNYTDLLKREPGAFSARTWSLYARLYFRHFNELPHEFQGRLNRGYKPSKLYMESFTSPILSLYAKTIAFAAGSFLAVLVLLTLWDFDVLEVEHLFAVGAVLTFVVHICRTLIPDENAVCCPEQLMRRVIAQVHYAPDSWRGQAHTFLVRDQFAQLFQYKAVYILEELLSPIITPFILIFWIRKRSQAIIDFFRHFSIDIDGVGDVCSFAQLDIKKHGDPKWHDTNKDEGTATFHQQADDGKVELSLMHFAVSNPQWNVPQDEDQFLTSVKLHAQKNVPALNDMCLPPDLLSSSLGPDPTLPANAAQSLIDNVITDPAHSSFVQPSPGPASVEGAMYRPGMTSLLRGGAREKADHSLLQQTDLNRLLAEQNQSSVLASHHRPAVLPSHYDTIDRRREMTSMEMSVSALYMHELHHLRLHHRNNAMMWETIADTAESEVSNLPTVPEVGSASQTASLHPHSASVQQGYDSMSPLTGKDLFGDALDPRSGQKSTTSSRDQSAKPFLAIPTQEPTGSDRYVPNGEEGNSSDSDAAPQEFHLDDRPFHDTTFSSRKSNQSDSFYRPPQM